MKNNLRIINMIICVMIMSFGLASCSNSSEEEHDSSIIGTWYVESLHDAGTSYEYTEYAECSYKKDGTVSGYWKETFKDGKIEEERDGGRYETDGQVLLVWWNSEKDNDEPWSATFTISGDKMTTSENGGTVWTRKK